jgi:sugar lactone lactonase YvrE
VLQASGIRHIDAGGRVSTIGSWDIAGLVIEHELFIYASSTYHVVSKFDPRTGSGEVIAGDYMFKPGNRDGVGFDAAFNQPAGLASDRMGNVYVADLGNGAVRRLALESAAVTTLASGFDAPLAVAVGDGEVFVAEKRAIRRIRTDSGAVGTLAGAEAGWKEISAIVYDPAGVLYVSDTADARVRAVVVSSGQIFDVVGQSGVAGVRLAPLPAAINQPSGLALLPSGELVISSTAENAILIAR